MSLSIPKLDYLNVGEYMKTLCGCFAEQYYVRMYNYTYN